MSLPAIDRDGSLAQLQIARGDRVRFGETLHQHGIRNGTRGSVERYAEGTEGSVRLAIRLDDGRLIEDAWSGFAHQGRRRHTGIPKIVHAVAGSAYSVQGRTALAAVYHIAGATDARETYVALTRHRHDVRIVVESERLDAACRARQEDPRVLPTRTALQERLFSEARRYREKSNVVDHVADRMSFIATGIVGLARQPANIDIVLWQKRPVASKPPHVTSESRAEILYVNWLSFLNTYRTLCCAPEPDFREILEDARALRFAA